MLEWQSKVINLVYCTNMYYIVFHEYNKNFIENSSLNEFVILIDGLVGHTLVIE